MKYFLIVYFYMVGSGIIGGLAHNNHHEKCGTSGNYTTDQAIDALLWPVALGVVVTMDDDKYQPAKCNVNNKLKRSQGAL